VDTSAVSGTLNHGTRTVQSTCNGWGENVFQCGENIMGTGEPNPRLKVQLQKFPNEEHIMRGVLLWLIGIPIPIIILLYLFNVV
jgi:hypothetical protein